jgi:hypothetical protein
MSKGLIYFLLFIILSISVIAICEDYNNDFQFNCNTETGSCDGEFSTLSSLLVYINYIGEIWGGRNKIILIFEVESSFYPY